MIEGPSACGREQSIRARDPNNRFRHGRGSRYRGAVPWPPHTSSPLPDLRFHHGKCAQSIEGEDGKMCPTTISPLMIWIEHDTQLMRDLADKVLVLHYGKELALAE